MLAACITIAFVACVASFTVLRLRSDRFDARFADIERRLDVTEMVSDSANSLATQADEKAGRALNKIAVGR